MSSGESRARYFSVETRDPPRYANRPNLARGGRRAQHASRFGGETLTRGGEREPCDVSTRAHLRSSIRSPRSSVRPVICGVPRRNTRTPFVFGFGIAATGRLVAQLDVESIKARGAQHPGEGPEGQRLGSRASRGVSSARISPRGSKRLSAGEKATRGAHLEPQGRYGAAGSVRVKRASDHPGQTGFGSLRAMEIKPSILCEVS